MSNLTYNTAVINKIHDEAMDCAESALIMSKRRVCDKNDVKQLYHQAFELEKTAAMMLDKETDCEPTRSVLFRSAGWLALDAGLKSEALEMAEKGLEYCTFLEIKEELEELKQAAL